MRKSLRSALGCPACAGELKIDSDHLEALYQDNGAELKEGLLHCSACALRYPVICGVPILLMNVYSWLRTNYYYIVEGALHSGGISNAMNQYLDSKGWRMSAAPANNYYELPRWISIFASTHYDTAPVGLDDESPLGHLLAGQPSVFDAVMDSLNRHMKRSVSRALDIGANVGGMAFRLAAKATQVIGIDTAFNPILCARRIQRGMPLPQTTVRRYIDGMRYEEIAIGPAPDNTEFLLASAFDLPINGQFGLITALNVIDVVPDPIAFVEALVDRLEPGGLLVLTSPYSWGSDDVPLDNWLGGEGVSSSQALLDLLPTKGLTVIDESDFVPWVLREHKRWYRVFHNHCVMARKGT